MRRDKPPILSAKKLRKAFHNPVEVEVLKDINLEVYEGESIAITGASGEGKSTLLQILGTLETPSSGELRIGGIPANSRTTSRIRNKELGFIFQSFHLLDDYTVLENILMPARIARESTQVGSPAYQRATTLLEEVGLSDRAHFNTKLLSGGEKQRVALARAFCNSPRLILADEPTGNLDSDNSQHIHDILLNAVKELNKALIVVTHNPALAKLCDRHLILREGTLHCATAPS